MSKPRGKTISISPFRWMVIDLMHFSRQVPAVTLERRMALAPLVEARAACNPRPSWTAIFVKAYSIVAARQPLLRRAYMSFPWPRFYEHPRNIVCLNISRQFGDEDVVMPVQIRSPENRSLTEIDALIRTMKDQPVEECENFRRVRALSRCPWFIRRLIFWATINVFGRRRAHNLGTFGITTVSNHGAGVLSLIPLMTSTVFYGLFDDRNCLDVRLAIDHRVLDGVPAAEALVSLEATLLGEILEEVKGLASPSRVVDFGRKAA